MELPINQIIQGNCLELMKSFPENCIDLTITSPPYDNLRDYQGYSFDFENIAKELFRITKDGGVVVWIVGDATVNGSETGTSFKQALYFKKIGFNLHDTMIYFKNNNPFPENVRYSQRFEYMFILSKDKPKTINLLRDRKNKQPTGTLKTGSTFRNKDGKTKIMKPTKIEEYGFRCNVWEYDIGFNKTTKDDFAYEHPAMFPEQLVQDHIISWSNKNDLVFDPMNGSGTTTKMAKLLGRNFIGIDISKDYCEIAKQRLRQEILL